MKFTIERKILQQGLARVAAAVAKKTSIPILAHVKIVAERGRVTLTACDLDMEATVDAAADVAQPGARTIDAKTLTDIVNKLPDGAQVLLTLIDGDMELRSGRAKFRLHTLDPVDFPEFDAGGEFACDFTLDASVLHQMAAKTMFAASTEETRYYLNGIYLHIAGEMLCAVATDGHRLARMKKPAPDGAHAMPAVIVPRKACAEIERMTKDCAPASEIRIQASATKLRATLPGSGLTLTTKLVDGTYPDYQRVIPTGNDRLARLSRPALAQAVDRVSTVSSERGRAVKCTFEDGELKLSVVNPDSGSADEAMEADYESTPTEIGFNAKYIGEVLDKLDGEIAKIALGDSTGPALFTGADESLTIILMPMRV